MQTITFTKRSTMNKLHTWRDELNQLGRCGVNGTFCAVPGATVVTWRDADDVLVLEQAGPYVGQPATIQVGTDRHPATVIAVSPSGAKVTVRRDKAIRVDGNGMSDCQEYTFEADEQGEVQVFHRGAWGYKTRGYRLRLGARDAFHDYTV